MLSVKAMYEVLDGQTGKKVPDPKRPEEAGEETILVAVFPEGVVPAKVGTGLSMTMNLGNYESAKVEAWVELPCYAEEHEAAMAAATRYAEEAIRKVVRGVRSGEKVIAKFDKMKGA